MTIYGRFFDLEAENENETYGMDKSKAGGEQG